MHKGRIKKWFDEKGYGFIEPDEGGDDVFIHVSVFKKAGFEAPQQDERVLFEIGNDRGRTQATSVAPD